MGCGGAGCVAHRSVGELGGGCTGVWGHWSVGSGVWGSVSVGALGCGVVNRHNRLNQTTRRMNDKRNIVV